MKSRKSLLALLLVLTLLVTGCADKEPAGNSQQTNLEQTDTSTEQNVSSDYFTQRDLDDSYSTAKSAVITLNGSTAACSSDAVKISGSTVTITDEGTYILSGTLDNGMIVVDAGESDKPQLVLNGAAVHNDTSAALYILQADKVVVTLAQGTENTLSAGESFEVMDENNIDGAVFSKQDLTFNGSGKLTVTSPAGHGIVCKDDLVFVGGTYNIVSAAHGIDANDSVRTVKADITVDAGKDGIHAENSDDSSLGFVYAESGSFTVAAEGDGISAGAYLQIEDGTFDITAGGGSANAATQTSDFWGAYMGGGPGGKGGMGGHGGPMGGGMGGMSVPTDTSAEDSTSMKGLKAASGMTVNGGIFQIDAADDAVHSNTSLTVNGGRFTITTGDDGLHADDTLTVSEGVINITESYEGLEGLTVAISGGDIDIVSRDDGINAAGGTDESGYGGLRGNDAFGPGGGMGGGMMGSSGGAVRISGGDIYMNASGDGIDANGTLEISGGYVVVCGPTQGDTAVLDYDISAEITGGTFIGTGSYMMAQTFSGGTQGVIAVSVGNQSAGTQIKLTDEQGREVISCAPKLPFAIVIISSGDVVIGENYVITVGDASGTFAAS